MTNAIQAAIDAAKAQTAAKVNEVATVSQNQNAVQAYTPQPRMKGFGDLTANVLNVDNYLKVDENGLSIKGKKGLVNKIRVAILFDENGGKFQICEAIKYGNPAVYYKTYDGVKAVTGGSWQEAVNKALAADPSAKTYESADINMTLLEDVKSLQDGSVLAAAGTTLGHSTSTTNKANLKAFIDDAVKLNLVGKTIEVEITAEERTNKSGNTWGVLKFTIIGEVEESE